MTGDYWVDVRALWTDRMRERRGVVLKIPVDGMPFIEATFAQAERDSKGEAIPAADIKAIFDQWVARPPPPPVAMASP